ncbi:MAG: 6-pyruvoyl trahydropterin synthase family protein [Deltaproteobacteria bacterium]
MGRYDAAVRYYVSKELRFSGAHAIRLRGGKCERRHGHDWRLRVTVGAAELDELGLVLDFADLKTAVREVLAPFEHRDLNETPPFDRLNPTAENIARLVFEGLAARLDDGRTRVERVEVWETERSRAVCER